MKMRINKKSFIFTIMLILLVLSVFVLAANIKEGHGEIFDQQNIPQVTCYGLEIKPRNNMIIQTSNAPPSVSNMTFAYIFNSTGQEIARTNNCNASVACIFNTSQQPILLSRETYFIQADRNGDPYAIKFSSSPPATPFNTTNIEWVGRVTSAGGLPCSNFPDGHTSFDDDLNTWDSFTFFLSTIDVSLHSPPDNDHNNVDGNFTFNYSNSATTSGNCTLYLNGASNESVTLVEDGGSRSLIPSIPEGAYTWLISCDDGDSVRNSSSRTYIKDVTEPTLTWISPLSDNSTTFNTPNITIRVQANDTNLFRVKLNCTFENGTVFYLNESGDLDQTGYDINQVLNTPATSETVVCEGSATDDHTDGDIRDLKKGKKGESEVVYTDESSGKNLSIKVYFIEKQDKLTDTPGDLSSAIINMGSEYKWLLNFTVIKPETKIVFKISADTELFYRNSEYAGHFVWEDYYTDFEDTKTIKVNGVERSATVTVQEHDGYYLVRVEPDTPLSGGDFVEIDPVTGGLNTVIENVQFEILNFIRNLFPEDNANNDTFLNVTFTYEHPTNINGSCLLYVNNTLKDIKENIVSGSNSSLFSDGLINQQTYSWYVNCSDNNTFTTSAARRFTFDIGNVSLNVRAKREIDDVLISNFTVNISCSDQYIELKNTSDADNVTTFLIANNVSCNITVDKTGFRQSMSNFSINTTQTFFNITVVMFQSNTTLVNFRIFNISTLNFMTQDVTIKTIGDNTSLGIVNSTSNGRITLNLAPDDYEIRFNSTNFNPISKFITVFDNRSTNVTVYMTLNISQELQRIDVRDTSNQEVEGAVVVLQKETINGSLVQWFTVQEAITNSEGTTSVFVERDVTIFYRFAVVVDGINRPILPNRNFFTTKTNFLRGVVETIQLVIDLEDTSISQVLEDRLQILTSLEFVNETTVTYTFLDGGNTISGGRLRVFGKFINESIAYQLVSDQTIAGTQGEITYEIIVINNTVYEARGFVIYADSEELTDVKTKHFDIIEFVDKNFGLLISAIIIIVTALITVPFGALRSLLFVIGSVALCRALQFLDTPNSFLTASVAIIVMFFIKLKQK